MKSQEYEKEVIDSDEMFMVDGDVNPHKYIDITIQRALSCLSKDNPDIGFFQYIVLINNLEGQCKAINKLSKQYYENLKKYTDSEDYKSTEKKSYKQQIKLANKKYELIMTELNLSKKIETPLIIKNSD